MKEIPRRRTAGKEHSTHKGESSAAQDDSEDSSKGIGLTLAPHINPRKDPSHFRGKEVEA